MGGGQSMSYINFHKKSDAEIMKFMLPLYYTTHHITERDMDLAHQSWDYICTSTSPKYLDVHDSNNLQKPSCISWFYTTYYNRLFDVHPACKPLFNRGTVGQGNFLVKMITLTLNQLRYPKSFQQTMENLAARHCGWGVRGVEYGIVGDVLFYSLQYVLGDEVFSDAVQVAWWRIYSAMLTHILPICIRHERDAPALSDISNTRPAVAHALSKHEPKLITPPVSEISVLSNDRNLIVEDV